MKHIKERIGKVLRYLYKKIRPYLHWKMLLVFGGVWIISTGIWYVIAFAPLQLPSWLVWFARGYIGFLYLPTTPEKLITIPLSGKIYKKIFKEEIDRRLIDVNKETKKIEINNSRYK